MEQERTPRERALDLIRLLVGVEPNWQPAPYHYLWAIRVAAVGTLSVVVLVLMGDWIWGMLIDYIHPKTATQRKDVANIFVVIAAGVVGTLTAIAAIGNLIISRRNLQNAQATLQQQRELDERRAQDEALQAYFDEMGKLLFDKDRPLRESEEGAEVRTLARARTLTVVRMLGPDRKRSVVDFLYESKLLRARSRNPTIVPLGNLDRWGGAADLSGAELAADQLELADLSGTDLSRANLSGADLSGASLVETNLSDANLSDANLIGATGFTNEELEQRAKSLEGATMPNGQKHKD